MIVDRNAALPLPAGSAPGKAGTPGQPSGHDRTAWLKEMEKQEMTAWLSHPATQPGRAAPVAASVYARLSPPAMPTDMPASADGQDAGRAPESHRQSPVPDGEARAGLRESATQDRAGNAAEGSAGHQRERPEQEADGAAAAAPGVMAAAQAASAGACAPAGLVAAVMSALAQEDSAAGVSQPAQAMAAGVPAPADRAGVAPQAPAVPLPRALAIQSAGSLASAPPAAPRSGAATQESRSGDVQGRRASAAAQAGTPGEAPAPLRIHTVSTGSGLRVWIGADQAVGLSGQQLLLAAMEIRRLLKDQGTPLASLIYNGESVFEDEGRSDANTPRTAAASGTGPRRHIKT